MINGLFDFIDRAMGEAGRAFVDLPYERDLCDILEACVLGDLPGHKKNLIVTIPPRHFKTTFCSQLFPAWCFAEVSPDCEFILTSATATLAVDNAISVYRTITEPWYQELYPDVQISKVERDLQNKFRTTATGSVYATGLGGTITGYGAGKVRDGFGGAIIIDDPLKADDARSKTQREKCIKYYLETLKSRRNNAAHTPFILVMQRLHVEDLVGWIMANEPDDWYLMSFPAIKDGQLLNPVTTTRKELERLKIVSPSTYYAQYEQSPIVPGGNLLKAEWWQIYDPATTKIRGLRFCTADTAYKEHEDNDQSVIQCWEATQEGLYFIDSMFGRWEFPKLLKNAIMFYNVMGKPREFWVEDKASGTPLAQTMVAQGLPARAWQPKAFDFPDDKVSRVQESTWLVHGGKVFLPKGNTPVRIDADRVLYLTPGAAALVEEAAQFTPDMSHSHDDHVDAFTMAISLYKDAAGI